MTLSARIDRGCQTTTTTRFRRPTFTRQIEAARLNSFLHDDRTTNSYTQIPIKRSRLIESITTLRKPIEAAAFSTTITVYYYYYCCYFLSRSFRTIVPWNRDQTRYTTNLNVAQVYSINIGIFWNKYRKKYRIFWKKNLQKSYSNNSEIFPRPIFLGKSSLSRYECLITAISSKVFHSFRFEASSAAPNVNSVVYNRVTQIS